MFHYGTHPTDAALERLLQCYERTGRAVPVDFRKLVSYLSTPDRATHLLHPYPAKLLTHIPYFFLANSRFSREGDVVADPFCGSGTVLLEAQLAGRLAIGADSNPLARLLSKVKTSPIRLDVLTPTIENILGDPPFRSRRECRPPDVVNLDHWFYPHIIRQLQAIRGRIEKTNQPDVRDLSPHLFFQLRQARQSCRPAPLSPRSDFDKVSTLKATGFEKKSDAHLRRLRRINVTNVFADVLKANTRRMASLEPVLGDLLPAQVVSCDARSLGDKQIPTCLQAFGTK